MKKHALALVLALALPCSGCLGPDNAHNSIRNWNANATEHDWLNEVIFIGLTVVPVYGLAYLGDILIFNTIDYWSGDNPIEDPGPFPHADFTGDDGSSEDG
jgi:hypothetical protein